jgi:hypothetical protein
MLRLGSIKAKLKEINLSVVQLLLRGTNAQNNLVVVI